MTTRGFNLTWATSPNLTLSENPERASPRSIPLRENPLETRGIARKIGAASSRIAARAQAEKIGRLPMRGSSTGLRSLSLRYSTVTWRDGLLAAKADADRRISYAMNAEVAAKR